MKKERSPVKKKLSLHSDPIDWLEPPEMIKTGTDAIKFIHENGKEEFINDILKALQTESDRFSVENPSVSLNSSDIGELECALSQPILVPMGAENFTESKNFTDPCTLCCFLFFIFVKGKNERKLFLQLSILLDEVTRKFTKVLPVIQVSGKPTNTTLN